MRRTKRLYVIFLFIVSLVVVSLHELSPHHDTNSCPVCVVKNNTLSSDIIVLTPKISIEYIPELFSYSLSSIFQDQITSFQQRAPPKA